jgi:intein/homing endonuclease
VNIGDGNLYKTKRMHRVTYSGNLTNEREFYLSVLKGIVSKLYDIEPLCYERKSDNTVLLIINSKNIVNFKIKIGLHTGNKKKIRIPKFIMKNDVLLKNCLKGLGDTDFSLSFKKNRKGIHTEPRLELFSQSKYLIKDVSDALKRFGFTFSTEHAKRRDFDEFRIRIYGKRNLENWIKHIGFLNPRINMKIAFWKKFDYFEFFCSDRKNSKEILRNH